ncbi:MAG: isoprenylcysteine carboxylmethyltransferase family protein [Marinobacter sp.]|nr:isoprenylcysteine carboxylmethyltransferase family protein [Marinobacter sp.]
MPPIIQVVLVLAVMWGLSRLTPALTVSFMVAPWLGGAAIAAGAMLAVLGVLEFRNARTTVDPRYPEQSAHLVVSGVYRYSRNPMYLGFLMILLGTALCLTNLTALMMLPVFVLYMNRFQIQPEERFMRQKFGQEYEAYAGRVRRWL